MFKKHEKLFSVILTVSFCIGIIGFLFLRRGPLRSPSISLNALSTPSGDPAITNGKININTADATMLQLLPGIGPALSSRILEYRNTNGYFHTIEDLLNVKGIGEVTYQKISAYITVGGAL